MGLGSMVWSQTMAWQIALWTGDLVFCQLQLAGLVRLWWLYSDVACVTSSKGEKNVDAVEGCYGSLKHWFMGDEEERNQIQAIAI